jgi:GH24 family phage-related lysozyme (muramidase)
MNRTAIFDLVRSLMGRGFKQEEVERLDRAIDCATGGETICPADGPRNIGEAGLKLIKKFEGCASLREDGLVEAYPDPATGGAPWTIGWGSTGSDIKPGSLWTLAQCDARFAQDLGKYSAEVAAAIGDAPTSQAQFDALVSFHYNTGAISRATLTRKHIAGDFDGAAREFVRWNRAAGRVLKGLTKRRQAEAALYASGSGGN